MFSFKRYRDYDINLTCVYAAAQRWRHNAYYSFLGVPRPNFGYSDFSKRNTKKRFPSCAPQ